MTLEELIARNPNTAAVSEKRKESLARAIELGAGDEVLLALLVAGRVRRAPTMVLPAHRLEGMSRGRGWARKGRGQDVQWGERVDGGYKVGTGRWVVGGNDGFHRKGEDVWTVKQVAVGAETWTTAS